MAKNERNYKPKTGKPFAVQYNGTQTSPAAPMPIWQAGAEGGKFYSGKFTTGGVTNSVQTVYWSPDGVSFVSIFSEASATGVPETKTAFTDFWALAFRTDENGDKFVNFEAGGGFFIDVNANTETVDIEAYGEDY